MERGALKGHGALLLANVIWGLNSPICKTVLLSPENPEGLNHFALTVYRLVGAFLLFWLASAFLPRERVAWRDLGGLFVASLFGIQLDQILFLWGLSLTSPINVSIIATTVPILTMILAMFFLREPITPLKTGGVLLGDLMYVLSGGKINPLIGSAGVSAVPMAARVSQVVGQKENPANFLLMHAMGPNVAGVIGSAIAAGVLMALFG